MEVCECLDPLVHKTTDFYLRSFQVCFDNQLEINLMRDNCVRNSVITVCETRVKICEKIRSERRRNNHKWWPRGKKPYLLLCYSILQTFFTIFFNTLMFRLFNQSLDHLLPTMPRRPSPSLQMQKDACLWSYPALCVVTLFEWSPPVLLQSMHQPRLHRWRTELLSLIHERPHVLWGGGKGI